MVPAFRRILVGVDDSPSAQAALAEAIELAHDGNAELVLAHVTSILDGNGHAPPRPHRIPSTESAAILAEALARARAAGVAATTELLIGYAPRQLALVADDRDVDLVIVGSRRLSGAKRAVLGSTSQQLLKESERPVLIVPDPQEER